MTSASRTPRQRKLTPKQRVLKMYPKARADWKCDDCCYIVDGATNERIGGGWGWAPKNAWAETARRLA